MARRKSKFQERQEEREFQDRLRRGLGVVLVPVVSPHLVGGGAYWSVWWSADRDAIEGGLR